VEGIVETPDDVRGLLGRLGTSVWAFAAVQAALESGLLAPLAEEPSADAAARRAAVPADLAAALIDVLVALRLLSREGGPAGVRLASGLPPLLDGPAGEQVRAILRATGMQAQALVSDARTGTLAPGWRHSDPELLQAQGFGTAPVFQMLARVVFPRLSDLDARLRAPSAAFLDVGAGVGAVGLVMCGLYPTLRVVGLEPQTGPRELAARNIAAAGLDARVEIRPLLVEELTDRAAFDLAWLPQVFLPAAAFAQGLRTTLAALRPGGWLLTLAMSAPGEDLEAAVSRLTNVLFGGTILFPEQVAQSVAGAGFSDVRTFPGPTGSTFVFIAGQRPG
jgi:hypothetical protein